MKNIKKLWRSEKWFEFSDRVKNRDGYKCLKCKRNKNEVILQVHHQTYVKDKSPWEYSLSDCLTLCKGCHAREHNIIEPSNGWTLLSIDDLGGLDGHCERKNCGSSIRYEHLTYHPNWGYKIVGSTCIEHLTEKDILLSSNIIKSYNKISEFVYTSDWDTRFTKKNKEYIKSKYKHHEIRIYGKDDNYSYQLVIKQKGIRWHDYRDIVSTKNKHIDQVKELAYVVLLGTITKDKKEKELLRDIYKRIK